MNEIERVKLERRNAIGLAHYRARVTDLPKLIGEGFSSLSSYIGEGGGDIAEAPFVAFSGYRREGDELRLDENDMNIQIVFPLRAPVAGSGSFQAIELPATEAVRLHYKGNYDAGMTDAYARMLKRIEELGGEFSGVSYESYLTGEDTPLDGQETVITLPFKLK